jgi:Resolvase, N terminal domain/Recombinase
MTPRTRATRQLATPTLGYTSVAAGEPLDGPAIEKQRLAIEDACKQLNLRLVDIVRDHRANGADDPGQPGLQDVLDRIDSGEASCLIVSDLECLTRRTARLEKVLDRLDRDKTRLVALDVGLDSASETGRLAVTPLVVTPPAEPEPEPAPPEWEQPPATVTEIDRRRPSERPRPRRAAPRRTLGTTDGPARDWETIRARIQSMRADGMTLQAIADTLNEEGVPTLRGGAKWRPSSVQTATGYRRPSRSTTPKRT